MAEAAEIINSTMDSSRLSSGSHVIRGSHAIGDIQGMRLYIQNIPDDKIRQDANRNLTKLLEEQRAKAESRNEAFNHNFVAYNYNQPSFKLLTREEADQYLQGNNQEESNTAEVVAGTAAAGAGLSLVDRNFLKHNPVANTIPGNSETQPAQGDALTADKEGHSEYLDLWKQVKGYDASIFATELNEDQLITNASFQNAARLVFEATEGKTWEEHQKENNWSNERAQEELGKWGIEHAAGLEQRMDKKFGNYLDSDEQSAQFKVAQQYMRDAYDHKDMNGWTSLWRGTKNTLFKDKVSVGLTILSVVLAVPTGGVSLGVLAASKVGQNVAVRAVSTAASRIVPTVAKEIVKAGSKKAITIAAPLTNRMGQASQAIATQVNKTAFGRVTTRVFGNKMAADAAKTDFVLEAAISPAIGKTDFETRKDVIQILDHAGYNTNGRENETYGVGRGLQDAAWGGTFGYLSGRVLGGVTHEIGRGVKGVFSSSTTPTTTTNPAPPNSGPQQPTASANPAPPNSGPQQPTASANPAPPNSGPQQPTPNSNVIYNRFNNASQNAGNGGSSAQPHQGIPQQILDAIARGDAVEYTDPNTSFKVGQTNGGTSQGAPQQSAATQPDSGTQQSNTQNTTGAQQPAGSTNNKQAQSDFDQPQSTPNSDAPKASDNEPNTPAPSLPKGDHINIDLPEHNTEKNWKSWWLKRSWKPHMLFSHPIANREAAPTDPYPMLKKIVGAVDDNMNSHGLIDELRAFDKRIKSLSKELGANPSKREEILSKIQSEITKFSEQNGTALEQFGDNLQHLRDKVSSYKALEENDGTKAGLLHITKDDVVLFSHKQATLDYLSDLIDISQNLQKHDFGKEGARFRSLTDINNTAALAEGITNSMNRVNELVSGSHERLNPKGTDSATRDALLRGLAEGYYNSNSRAKARKYNKNLEVLWQTLETRYLSSKKEDGTFPEEIWVPESAGRFADNFKEFYDKGFEQEGLYLARYLQMRRGDDKIATFPETLAKRLAEDSRYTTDPHYKQWVDSVKYATDTSEQGGHRLLPTSVGRGPMQFFAEQSYFYRFATRFGKGPELSAPRSWMATPGWITLLQSGITEPLIKSSYFLGATGTKKSKPGSWSKIVPDWNGGENWGLKNNPLSRAAYRIPLGGLTSKPARYTALWGGGLYATGYGLGEAGDYWENEHNDSFKLGTILNGAGYIPEQLGKGYLWTGMAITDSLSPVNYIAGDSLQGWAWKQTLGGVSAEEALELINENPAYDGYIDAEKLAAAAVMADKNDDDEANVEAYLEAARKARLEKALQGTTETTQTTNGGGDGQAGDEPEVRDTNYSHSFKKATEQGSNVLSSLGGGLSSIFEGAFPNSGISQALSGVFNWTSNTFSDLKNNRIQNGTGILGYGIAAVASLMILPKIGERLGFLNFGGLTTLLLGFLAIGYGGRFTKGLFEGQGVGNAVPNSIKNLSSNFSHNDKTSEDTKPETKIVLKDTFVTKTGDGDEVYFSDEDGDGKKEVKLKDISINSVAGQSSGKVVNVPSMMKIVTGVAANDVEAHLNDLERKGRVVHAREMGKFAGADNFEGGAEAIDIKTGQVISLHSLTGKIDDPNLIAVEHREAG